VVLARVTGYRTPAGSAPRFFHLKLGIVESEIIKPCFQSIIFLICFTKVKEMAKEYLGEFEELVLTMVAILKEDAYGAMIIEEIERRQGRQVNLSAVHVTLYRLEDKGLIKSGFGGATSERGGRRKRIYKVTNAGFAMLKSMKESRLELWKLIPQLKISGL
jgi:PadR family transcriptional regulator, regulatory protein PadR